MFREYSQNLQVVCDLFGRESGGFTPSYIATENTQEDATPAPTEQAKKVKPQFSEDLWEHALKRHCDSRQNLRNLLDRYIKPHN